MAAAANSDLYFLMKAGSLVGRASSRPTRAPRPELPLVTGSRFKSSPALQPCNSSKNAELLHEPAVADHHGLPGQRGAGGCREIEHRIRHLVSGGELAVHRVLQHDALDDVVFADVEFLGLLGDLLVDQGRAYEARADHV